VTFTAQLALGLKLPPQSLVSAEFPLEPMLAIVIFTSLGLLIVKV
jgi:hypothetical protein